MNFESVRSIIDTYIKKNGVEAITGDILNNVLNTMLDDVDTAISSIEPSPGGGSGEGGVSEEDVLNILEKNNYITSSALSSYYTKAESDARYLALSGGTITGDLFLNQYLRINAFAGYGSGSANAWYNGNTQMLLWENVSGMGLGSNVVIHSGNIGSYALPISGGNLTGRLVAQAGISSWQGADLFSSERLALNLNSNNAHGVYVNLQQSDVTKFMLGYSPVLGAAWFENANGYGFYLSDSGNVGIGTTSPQYKLEVNGTSVINGSLGVTELLYLGAGALAKYDLYDMSSISGFRLVNKDNKTRLGFYSYDDSKVCFIENLYGGIENCGIGLYDSGAIRLFGGDVTIEHNLIVSGDVASA